MSRRALEGTFGAVLQYELARALRTGTRRSALLLGLGAAFAGFWMQRDSDRTLQVDYGVFLLLPVFAVLLMSIVRGARNLHEGSAGGYLASRPVSRRTALATRALALAASSGSVIAAIVMAAAWITDSRLTAPTRAGTYTEVLLVEQAGRELRFQTDEQRARYEAWKSGSLANKACPRNRNKASFVALNPWLLLAICVWFYLLLGALCSMAWEVERPAPGSRPGSPRRWHFWDRWGPISLLVAAELMSLVPAGGWWYGVAPLSPTGIAAYPWVIPLIGSALVAAMLVTLRGRLLKGDLRG